MTDPSLQSIAGVLDRFIPMVEGFEYRWTVEPIDGGWKATCQAGHAIGPNPKWGGRGATAEEALRDAVSSAEEHWNGRTLTYSVVSRDG